MDRRTSGEASACLTAAPGAFDRVAEFSFKGGQAGFKKVGFRHDDQVETGRYLVVTKDLSNQTLRSVSDHRAAQLSRCGDAQPPDPEIVGHGKQREIPGVNFRAAIVDSGVLRTASNS